MIKLSLSLSSIKNFLKYLFATKRVVLYVGGYPNIPNVGDVALYNAYEYFFEDYTLVHFRGGRLEKFLYKWLAVRKVTPVLAGGTLINHMCLREAKDAYQLFGPLLVFGTGVAQTSYWKGKNGYRVQEKDWYEILVKSPYLGVRGPMSVFQLSEMKLESSIFGDPVFSLAQLRKATDVSPEGKIDTIGLNVGKSLGFVQGGEENLKEVFIELAKSLMEKGHKLKWFVVCPEDLEVTQEISKATSGEIVTVYRNFREYYSGLNDVQLLVGTKLHAVCLSLNYSVPAIMIEYRPKCRDFMSSLGLDDYSLPANNCNLAEVLSKIENIESTYEALVHKVNTNIEAFQKKQKEKVQTVLSQVDQ